MITCPECGGTQWERYRKPTTVGPWLIRRKRCACGHIFMTGELVIAGTAAELLEEALQTSSLLTPDGSASPSPSTTDASGSATWSEL